ncbi:hypothetical protein VTJ83DRAFT_1570 [Remersonia thermophila]|uniref:Uncharacterized protein n=1 Tax=Remersonia thermophila TaxID=72144 RepID=A0ABR4DGB9_9PEZI
MRAYGFVSPTPASGQLLEISDGIAPHALQHARQGASEGQVVGTATSRMRRRRVPSRAGQLPQLALCPEPILASLPQPNLSLRFLVTQTADSVAGPPER